ncbi:MAG: ATP-binding protein [Bacteroidota bacterium]
MITPASQHPHSLSEEHQLLQLIYEQSPYGIIILNEQQEMFPNRSCCELLGYTKKEFRQLSFKDLTHPDDLTLHLSGQSQLDRKEKNSYALEKRYLRKDGSILWAKVKVSNLSYRDSNKRIVWIEDITEQKQSEWVLNSKNRELQRYMASNIELENFAYFASHDLKEPLRTVGNFIQLLSRRYGKELPEEAKEFITFIQSAVKSMDALITNLLTYSKINSEEMEFEDVDVRDLILAVVKRLQVAIDERKATISLENIPPQIRCNPTSVSQLFQNLLSNAVKFGKEGIPLRIAIRCVEQSHFWEFSVEDNGIGIEEEYFEKIFLLFKKLHGKNHEMGKGTGIGLALCKKIVGQHFGHLTVASRPNEGTTFTFTLHKFPVNERSMKEAEEKASPVNS